MTQPISLGTWAGLKITISLWGIVSYLVAVPLVAVAAGLWLSLSLGEASMAGAFSSLMMFACESLHQWGHSRAARRTGYPMIGIHHFSIFSSGLYPGDEPPLPPSLHIRRALGGFWINLLVGLLLGAAAISMWPMKGWWGWVTVFSAVWNFFVLGLGALLPIDIPGVLTVDGATILHHWRAGKHVQHDS